MFITFQNEKIRQDKDVNNTNVDNQNNNNEDTKKTK